MTFNELNASGYKYNNTFYNTEFEDILSKIISCYHLMLRDKVKLTDDENSIRDILLLKYLKDNDTRKKIGAVNYLFDREVPEDLGNGRTDIKVQTINTFKDTRAYYTIECKRLDATNPNGATGLNAMYIANGICRFVSKTYSAHYKTNGMIGFVVKPLKIHENVNSINKLLEEKFTKANTVQGLKYRNISSGFKFSYFSTHKVDSDNVVIYHLMLDCSKNMT